MPLTTTSYAILGLLDLRDWTAYDLTQQARRSLTFVWPMSESQLYAEPKRLQQEGLLTITDTSAGPRRTRQLLSITDSGRKALRGWLATEPSAPRVQMEVLVRVLFATAGSKEELLSALESTRVRTQEAYDHGLSLLADYQSGGNPFPERLHANVIWIVFVRDLLLLTLNWLSFARKQVEQWTDSSLGGNPEQARRLVDLMVGTTSLLSTAGDAEADCPRGPT